jgi:hypothetical protein
MPNCAFYSCFHSRRYKDVSLFQIPEPRSSDSEFTSQRKQEARKGWIDAILRTRQLDADLKKQIENNIIYICEIHLRMSILNVLLKENPFKRAQYRRKTFQRKV